MASRLSIGVTACTAALVAATFSGAVPALADPAGVSPGAPVQQQPASLAPSASEVSAAKLSPATKATMAKRLQEALTTTSKQLEQVAEDAQTSWDRLSDAQQLVIKRQDRAKEASAQAEAAQKKVDAAQERVGQIAASAYRNGGFDPSATELLTGQDPQGALDRARTLSNLSEASTRDLHSSEATAALAQQWKDYAQATQRSAEQAVSEQTEAEATAQKQASGFRTAVETNTNERNTLLNRLASLNGTTVKDEEKALADREEKARQAALEAAKKEEAARAAQAAEAARAEQERQAAEQAAEDDQTVDGVSRPANVIDTPDSSDGGQEEGSPSDATQPATQDGTDNTAAPSQDDADHKAAEEAAKQAQAEADAKAKAEQEAKDKAAAEQKRAEEAAQKAEAAKQAQEEADRKAAAADAAEKAKAEKEAKDKAEAAKQAEAERKAAQEAKDKAEAAKKKAAAEKAAAKKAAAEKKAAEAKKKAEAAAKKKAEEEAAKKAQQEKDDEDNQPSTGVSSKEAAIAWALKTAANDRYGYIFGANGPTNFDCSSFALTAFAKSGVSMTRTSTSQYKNAPKHVPLSQLKRGDLVFSSSNGGASMYHVAIYLGDGQVVHARNPNSGISTTPLSWVNNLYPMAARY